MSKRFLSPFLVFLTISILVELLFRSGSLNSNLFPAPSQIFNTLIELKSDFMSAFLETLQVVLAGYFLSLFFGLLIALLFAQFEILKLAILPFAIFFQTVPIIAIAPLLVIYFGFGQSTAIASALIVSIFPVIATTLIGLESFSKDQKDLFQIYQANRFQRLFKLQLPQAYISIYSGLKTAAGLSVIGTVAGEFVAGGGLGALIDSARTQQRIDIVFACLILLSLIGLGLIGCLKMSDRLIQKYRPYGLFLKDT